MSARPSNVDWLIAQTPALERMRRAHYPTQGDVARIDVLEKRDTYIEIGYDGGKRKGGWVYQADNPPIADEPWLGAYYKDGKEVRDYFPSLRDALDWVLAGMPS